MIGSGDFDDDTHLLLSNTTSDNEDTGGHAGFSIANVSHNLAAGTWLENGGSVALSIGVKGYGRVTVSQSSVRLFTGSTATYTIKLNEAPTANVTITPTSGTTTVATVEPSSLTFTTSDYAAKTVTVTAGRAGSSTITHAVTSDDTDYQGILIGGVPVTVVTRPAHLSEGNDGCGIWELDVAVGDGTRDQVARISKDWTNPTEVRVSNGNPEITVKRQALDRYVNIYRMPFLNSVRSIVPNRAHFPDRYFRFYLTDGHGQVPLEVGESRMMRILLSINHEKLEECENKHLLSYYLKVTRVAEGEALGFVEQTAGSYSGSGQSGDAPPEQDNRAPTVASAIPDATITDEFGWKIVPLSGVFTDADGDLLTLEATFSDFEVAFGYVQYAEGPELVILASQRGTSNITVTANDERGGTVSDTFTVTVKAWPAVASPIADISSLAAGASKQISLSGVFSDADGDALSYSVSSSKQSVATVSKEINDETKAVTGLTVVGVAEGTATITVTAQDTDGNEASDSFDVTVPAPPNQVPTVASAIDDATIVNTSGAHEVALSGVFSDADADDSLTITAKSSQSSVATVAVASDGSKLTVTAKSRGSATITVTASDGTDEVSDTFTVKVKAAPVVASAISDITGLDIGDTRDPSLSAVFSDADGDAITVTKVASSDTSKVAVLTEVTTASDGSIAITGFTLSALDAGTATITVTAQDSDGNTVSDAFDVTVNEAQQKINNAPTVENAITDATIVNTSGTHDVALSNVFADADSDSLTLTAESSSASVATVSVAADYSSLTVTAKARGTTTITVTASDGSATVKDKFDVTVKSAPSVASAIPDMPDLVVGQLPDSIDLTKVFSDADGDTLTFSASLANYNVAWGTPFQGTLNVVPVAIGTVTFTVTAEDSDENSVSDSFDVTVVNSPPTVANAISDATIASETGTKQVSLSGVFDDVDYHTLTMTAKSSDTAIATVEVATDQSSLTVTAKKRGTATITVTANDGNGGSVEDTFTVTVKAAPVVASAIADVSELEIDATHEVSMSGVFSDADGDALTISATTSDSAVVQVSNTIDPATGSATAITVIGVDAGTATITVTARDSDGNSVNDAFDVTVPAAEQQQQPVELPGPVTSLTVTATVDSATASWSAPETGGAPDGYIVHLRPENGQQGSGTTKRPGADSTTVSFNNLESGRTYEVWVRAENEAGKGERVNATITLPGAPPEPEEVPGPVIDLQLSATSDSVTVSWSAPETGGAPDGYIVHISPEDGGKGKTKTPKAKKTSVTFNNLEAGTAYEVWIRAQNEAGKGERVHATITLPE